MRGIITQWKDEKGFGFIVSEDGDEKLFFHISAVKTQTRRPRAGDVVLYESMRDSQGRLKAKAVVLEGVGSPSMSKRNNKPIHTEPPKKNAVDYVAIIVLLGSFAGAVIAFFLTEHIEKAIPFGVAAAIAIVLLNRQKKPKAKRFTCARCRKTSLHDRRTIRVWNSGFLKLYCSSCHQGWLAEQPRQTQYTQVSGGSGGCLGVSALLVIVPIIISAGVYKALV
jgi:cold shock CspA family protein